MRHALVSVLAQARGEETDVGAIIFVGALALCFLALIVINILKGKYWTAAGTIFLFGLIGIICSIVGVARVAKPTSWWARRYYDEQRMREARYHHDAAAAAAEDGPGATSASCPQCGQLLDDRDALANHMRRFHGSELGAEDTVGQRLVGSSNWDESLRAWATRQARHTKPCPACGNEAGLDALFCSHCRFAFQGQD